LLQQPTLSKFHPSSYFKPVTIAMANNKTKIEPHEQYDTILVLDFG
jgi:hypothetical protein